MNEILAQLLVASTGLALATGLAWGVLRLGHWRPVRGYRLLRGILVLTLLALPGQALLQHFAAHIDYRPRLPLALLSGEPEPAGAVRPAPGAAAPVGPAPRAMAATEVPDFLFLPPAQSFEPARGVPATWVIPGAIVDAGKRSVSPAALVIGLYVLGLAYALLCLLRRLAATHRILRASRPVRDPGLLALWLELRDASPSHQSARYRLHTTDRIAVPSCLGFRHPTVLLPRGRATAGERPWMRSALQHELVHLERGDSWNMLAQELLVCLFWFHPAAHWLRRRLDDLRELSCDQLVVERTGRPKQYACALLECASELGPGFARALPAGLAPWTQSANLLTRRIEMLLSAKHTTRRPRRAGLMLATTGFLALWSGQLAFALALSPQATAPLPEPTPEPVPAPSIASDPLALQAPAAPLAPMKTGSPAPTGVQMPSAPGRFGPGAPYFRVDGQNPFDAPHQLSFGIYLERPGEALAAQVARPVSEAWVINGVLEGSVAERAGLERYDVVVEIDGDPATDGRLTEAKDDLLDGHDVTLGVRRGGRGVEVVVDSEMARELGWRSNPSSRSPFGAGSAPRALDKALRLRTEREDWAEKARDYYQGIQPEAFRSDLERALETYRRLDREGELQDRDQQHADYLRSILEGDIREYIEDTRSVLKNTPTEELRDRIDGALRYRARMPWAQEAPRARTQRTERPERRERPERPERPERGRDLDDLRRQVEELTERIEELRASKKREGGR